MLGLLKSKSLWYLNLTTIKIYLALKLKSNKNYLIILIEFNKQLFIIIYNIFIYFLQKIIKIYSQPELNMNVYRKTIFSLNYYTSEEFLNLVTINGRPLELILDSGFR